MEKSLCPKIRALCLSDNMKTLLVGTYSSEIWKYSHKDKSITANTAFISENIMNGHYAPSK